MLESEFKELMGLKEITEEQYTQADKIYLACDLSKKVFCDLYKHCSAEAILLLDNIVDILKEARAYQQKLHAECESLREYNKPMVETALEYYNSALELSKGISKDSEDYARAFAGAFEEEARKYFDIASQLGGYKEVVLMCLDKGYPLLKEEREYIINEMKRQ